MLGGKWTTYRAMAEDAINAVQQQLGLPVGGCVTREHHLSGSEGYSADYPQTLGRRPMACRSRLRATCRRSSGRTLQRCSISRASSRNWRSQLLAGYPAIQAEIAYSARNEMAATLDDVLERRTGLQFYSWKTAMAAAPVAAAVMQTEMGWDSAHTQREVDDYVRTISGWTQKIAVAQERGKGVEPSSWAEISPAGKGHRTMPDYVGAIDQGTTSTRFIVFSRSGQIVATAQKEHEQIYPQPGWVEHSPAGDLGAHAGSHRGGHAVEGANRKGPGGRRHHQPARDHGGVEPQDR